MGINWKQLGQQYCPVPRETEKSLVLSTGTSVNEFVTVAKLKVAGPPRQSLPVKYDRIHH